MKMRVDGDEDEQHSTMNWRKISRRMKLVTGWLVGWIESNTRIEREKLKEEKSWKRERCEKLRLKARIPCVGRGEGN